MSLGSPFIGGIQRGELAADNFTIIRNLIARDPRLRFFLKGLMLNLLSHAAGFPITEKLLASQSGDSEKAIRKGLDELRALGYVYRGVQLRHPKGTRSKDGRLIGGCIAGYQWFVTDQPEVVAINLAQFAKEQAVGEPSDPTLGDPVDNSDLAPENAVSPDLRKQGVIPGGDLLPKPTGGFDRTIEDHHKKTNDQEDQPHAAASGRDPRSPTEGSLGPETSPAADVGGPDPVTTQHGDQQTARAEKPRGRARPLLPPPPPVKHRERRSWREVRGLRPVDHGQRAEIRDELDGIRRRGLAPAPPVAVEG